MEQEYAWTMKVNGFTLARGWAPDLDRAATESMHYAMQYAEEGETKVQIRLGRKVVHKFTVAQAPA